MTSEVLVSSSSVLPTVRRQLRRLRVRAHVPAAHRHLRAAHPHVIYLGWVGRGNLGDEAIFDAHQRSLQPLRVSALPMRGYDDVLAHAAGDPRLSRRPLLLGGGTVVARTDWRGRVEAAERALQPCGLFMLGAGVEDPAFVGRRSYTSRDELERWKPLLARFDRVTVRGPGSQALLADIGVEATVCGDPALLWTDDGPCDKIQPDLIGLNVAWPEDLWGGDWREVVHRVAQAAQLLLRQGLRIRIVPLHPADVTATKTLLRELPGGAPVELVRPKGTAQVLDALRPCVALVGERLHAVVLGAAAHVPAVALDYRPKCADFQASIGRSEWLMPTRELPPRQLVEMTLELVTHPDRHRRELASGVLPLRDALRRESRRLRDAATAAVARR